MLFALAMALSLFGCSGAPETPAPTSSPETPAAEPVVAVSDNPFLVAEFEVVDVLSGSGNNVLGERGYIEVAKSDLPDFSSDEFSQFFSEFVNKRVKDQSYNWVSVIFDDDTGFCFISSADYWATYGDLDEFGRITDPLGESSRNKDTGLLEYRDFEIRRISNPTLSQEALVPDNYFEPAQAKIFTTPASENNLGDIAFYVDGKVGERLEVGGYDTFRLSTEYGDIYLSAVLTAIGEVSEGDDITAFFVYTGWSDKLDGAAGAYLYHE